VKFRAAPPFAFLYVRILKDFRSSRFASADAKGFSLFGTRQVGFTTSAAWAANMKKRQIPAAAHNISHPFNTTSTSSFQK
jgi:hypothetical protein